MITEKTRSRRDTLGDWVRIWVPREEGGVEPLLFQLRRLGHLLEMPPDLETQE